MHIELVPQARSPADVERLAGRVAGREPDESRRPWRRSGRAGAGNSPASPRRRHAGRVQTPTSSATVPARIRLAPATNSRPMAAVATAILPRARPAASRSTSSGSSSPAVAEHRRRGAPIRPEPLGALWAPATPPRRRRAPRARSSRAGPSPARIGQGSARANSRTGRGPARARRRTPGAGLRAMEANRSALRHRRGLGHAASAGIATLR